MKRISYCFLLLTLSIFYVYSFDVSNREFYEILEGYYSGKIEEFSKKNGEDAYIFRLNKFKDTLGDEMSSGNKSYFINLADYQIARLLQNKEGRRNSSKSYSVLKSTKKSLLELIASTDFKGLEKNIQSDIYRILGDVNLMLLRYAGGATLSKLANEARKYFEKSLKINSKNSLANTSIASWYLYAPRIAGGDSNKTLSFAQLGLKYGQTDVEKYFANIWISQAYFLLKNEKESLKYVLKASEIFPNGAFHKIVLEQNKSGNLFMDFPIKN
ncbi:hypothetical protein F0310_05170 (plasmid) [Borrelia sp. A-FGy1]|uniref:tetratricopeptide repeat protein n=1 Tax=Borrelia sp. A-FGy1 TaxID=2608247 RepID=UPI0015F5ED6F|nr:hypothetical protein [Borrelia sp. A-FGy1]QMU99809.1 hypothetical protein F0310_05170 [Borrelia sp. A-FGy1]